ncbi:MAG: hypothetical protein MZV63_63335 [Marinilabiliales bacterium]|nr:hypothetical protein [Marinilabiliales bacterium]
MTTESIVAVSILAGIGLLIFLAVRITAKRKEELDRLMVECGYYEIPPEEPVIRHRLDSLVGRGDHVAIMHPYRCSGNGYEAYRFEARIRARENRKSASLVERIVILSPSLDVPRFLILPDLPSGGIAGGFVSFLIDKSLASYGMTRLDFPDNPDFPSASSSVPSIARPSVASSPCPSANVSLPSRGFP